MTQLHVNLQTREKGLGKEERVVQTQQTIGSMSRQTHSFKSENGSEWNKLTQLLRYSTSIGEVRKSSIRVCVCQQYRRDQTRQFQTSQQGWYSISSFPCCCFQGNLSSTWFRR